jgi:prevent-host-death family protein
MKAIKSIYETKAHFSAILSDVESGELTVVVCRHGVPVARILPYEEEVGDILRPSPRLKGACFLGDPTAPLNTEDWPEELK